MNALRVIAPELPFPIEYLELEEAEKRIEFDGFRIEAFRVNHNVVCYGYNIVIDRIGRFQVEKAQALGLDRRYWNRLQKGETIELDGKTYTPDMVLGEARKGIKLTYCTDTRPAESIVRNAAGSDLFICEGMYGEPDKQEKAKQYKHMTFYEAASLAKKAGAAKMWLTHYSPSLVRAEDFMRDVKKIFPAAEAGKDGKSIELKFEDDE